MKKIPMYQIIEQEIKDKIKSGEYLPGQIIDSENNLKEIYHVTRMTVRQALGNLVFQEYLYKKKGKGTFVTTKALYLNQNKISDLWKIDDIGYKKNVIKTTLYNHNNDNNDETRNLMIEYIVEGNLDHIAWGQIIINPKVSTRLEPITIIDDYSKLVNHWSTSLCLSKKYTFKINQMTDDLLDIFKIKENECCLHLIESLYDSENQLIVEKSLILNPKQFKVINEIKAPI